MSTPADSLIKQGLWSNNPALVQLLGLCPLLAVSTSIVNALGLGLATILVLAASNLFVSLIRQQVNNTIRLPAFVLIIAGFVSCAELLLQAYAYPLYLRIGIFIPLIVTNCTVLGRAVSFAARNPALPAFIDGVMMGLGFSAVLLVMGFIRELLASGSVFANMELLLPFAANWELRILPNYSGFLLAILPPGAFILMGFILALRKWLDLKFTDIQNPRIPAQAISNHE
jgi:electron transport complex protein RnfE